MNNVIRKGLFMFIPAQFLLGLLLAASVSAGIVIEDYNAKLNNTQGVITKVEGNVLTLRSDSGNTISLRVKEQGAMLPVVGDLVKIQDGQLSRSGKLHPATAKRFDPQPEPPGMTVPNPTGSPQK